MQLKTPRSRGGLGHLNIPILADTTKVGAAGRCATCVTAALLCKQGLETLNLFESTSQ